MVKIDKEDIHQSHAWTGPDLEQEQEREQRERYINLELVVSDFVSIGLQNTYVNNTKEFTTLAVGSTKSLHDKS